MDASEIDLETSVLGREAKDGIKRDIGLALSGGGSRAIAFHLGSLRALRTLGLLDRVAALSTVSGGSVIGALYAAHDGPFEDFERDLRKLLSEGLVQSMIKQLPSLHGGMAMLNFLALACVGLVLELVRLPGRVLRLFTGAAPTCSEPPIPRRFSWTTLLMRTLDCRCFHGKQLANVPDRRGRLIINACDLTESSAFYFSPDESGSWRHGRLLEERDVSLSEAVAASAAYPAALPALDRTFRFVRKNGEIHDRRVSLADGGVYDNTALAPFWPGRDPNISLGVHPVSTVILSRAGYGIRRSNVVHFWAPRMMEVLLAALNRAESASVQRLFELKKAGEFSDVVLAYLGMNDQKLEKHPKGFVRRDAVFDYPTNFRAMKDDVAEHLIQRGEQVMIGVIEQHSPHLTTRPTNKAMHHHSTASPTEP